MNTVTIKERPILMHARSIRGILDGSKTQTRRIIKNPPQALRDLKSEHARNIRVVDGGVQCDWFAGVYSIPIRCPYGKPDDRLWVRETFAWPGEEEKIYRADEYADGFKSECDRRHTENPNYPTFKWTPGIHMPRNCSRLTLEITGIRVERVQDISETDAEAEGVELTDELTGVAEDLDGSYRKAFGILWDATNGTGAWERNDWVWVVNFRRIEAQ